MGEMSGISVCDHVNMSENSCISDEKESISS